MSEKNRNSITFHLERVIKNSRTGEVFPLEDKEAGVTKDTREMVSGLVGEKPKKTKKN